MSAEALLMELSRQGVRLKLAGDGQLSVRAPKGGFDEALRRRVAEHKPVLLDWLRQRDATPADAALPAIEPDVEGRHDPFPMSELQASFYVGEGEGMEYHVRPHYYLEHDVPGLDPARYEVALNTALRRQRFNLPELTADAQLQVPREFVPLCVAVHDLRALPASEVEAALLRTRQRLSRETLPLERWPWMSCAVSLQGAGRARLHLNHNNFFGDGYGTQRLLDAAMALYRDPSLVLPELTLSFRDCVLALARLEQSPSGEAARRYWEERVPALPGPPPVPRMPGVDTRVRSHLERRKTTLPAELWAAFKRYAQAHGLTPTSALIAVYAEVIAAWSGSRHFLLNNMATHRFAMHPEVAEVFGNFASLYPLEVDWREPGPFEVRARRLQDRLATDMRHLHWSGMKVLQSLNQAQRTPGRAPCPFVVGSGLFMASLQAPDFSVLETPQALLDYQFWELADGSLLAVWDLIESCFPRGLVDAMHAAQEQLLQHLATDARAWSAMSFELLPSAQLELRRSVNDTTAPLTQALLHDGLAAGAARFAGKPAVVCAEARLSYGELGHIVQRLTRVLRARGACPGQRVAILLDKGWQQVAAAHAVLAAGAAYVPIDPRWPQARIDSLLQSVGARTVVSQADLDCVHDEPLPAGDADPGDLAYVIFTSGSTGTPKGVMIDHRGALNTVLDVNRRFGVTRDDVFFGVSSLCFDLSVYDLFGCTAAGGTLVLPESGEPDPAAWLDQLQAHGVTVWNSVPALMQLLADAAEIAGVRLPALRLVLLSGDWIPVTLPAQVRRIAPNARVVSLGGATEASIWSIFHPVDEVDPAWTSVPYGLPLANQYWHVLDEAGRDAPTWVPGQLHIGGIGLALGYWGDAAKTVEAFISHPVTGERLYRTGDLGRYLPDGRIEFLGRADQQVKIQGYRVELGEIEAALLECAGVMAATVLATGSRAGRQLAAFYVAPVEVAPADLRDHLRARLPAYMVPQQLQRLERLPLTANGKVDRSTLGALGQVEHAPRMPVAPRDETERVIASLWEEVLDVRPVGVHDDFFELGGQSFAAVRLMTRIAQRFDRRLSLGVLLEDRSVEALARRVRQGSAWSPLVLLHHGEGSPWFLVHPAGGNVLCYRALAARLGRPVYGLQAAGLAGEQAPLATIEAMAALYLQAMRTVQAHGPYALGGWSSGGFVAFEMACVLQAEGEVVECVAMLDAPAPLQHAPIRDDTLRLWFEQDLQGLAAQLAADERACVEAVFAATVRAGRCYQPGTIAAPLVVLRAREGEVSEFRDHPALGSADWGWTEFTSAAVHCAEVNGTHYSLLDAAQVNAVAALMRAGLPS